MKKSERIPTKLAAQILGISLNSLYHGMITGDLDIGHIRKAKSGKTKRYDIYKSKLMKHVGWDEWPEGIGG